MAREDLRVFIPFRSMISNMEPGLGSPERRFDCSASLVVKATPALTLSASYSLKRKLLLIGPMPILP